MLWWGTQSNLGRLVSPSLIQKIVSNSKRLMKMVDLLLNLKLFCFNVNPLTKTDTIRCDPVVSIETYFDELMVIPITARQRCRASMEELHRHVPKLLRWLMVPQMGHPIAGLHEKQNQRSKPNLILRNNVDNEYRLRYTFPFYKNIRKRLSLEGFSVF